jgi:hypothetical protein
MKTHRQEQTDSNLPAKLAQPARRALAGVGIQHLEQLSQYSQAEIRRLHGIGPNALEQLRFALGEKGLSFATEEHQEKR